MSKTLSPVHPGEVLFEEFMKPLSLTMNRLALELHVPTTRIAEIVHGRRSITSDTALRLSVYFRTTPQFWMNLQASYDLAVAHDKQFSRIKQEVRPIPVSAGT